MGSREYARYKISCTCDNIGVAEWSQNDGWAFIHHGGEDNMTIDGLFLWQWPVPDGTPLAFFGRILMCDVCGKRPMIEEIDSVTYYQLRDQINKGIK